MQIVRYNSNNKFAHETSKYSFQVVKTCFIMKQRFKLGGNQIVAYISSGSDPKPGDRTLKELESSNDDFTTYTGPWARLTKLLAKFGLYEILAEPKRQYNVDEFRGYTPFVTDSNWGLEKIYCRNRKTRFVAIVEGKSALTWNQVQSSFWCFLIGNAITMFLFVAFMVWFALPPAAIGVICGFYILYILGSVRTSLGMKKVYARIRADDVTHDNEAEVIYQVQEIFRITKASEKLCWFIFFLEGLFLFVLPLGSLFHAGNVPVGSLFIFVSIITFARRYLNSTIAIAQLGSMDGIENDNSERGGVGGEEEEWREKHRLGKIVAEISSGKKNDFWMGVFGFFIFAICGVFMAAVLNGSDNGSNDTWTYTTAFEYPGSGDLQYTSCMLGQSISPPDGTANSLVDFAFLSATAYESPAVFPATLAEWFPQDAEEDMPIDHQDVVDAFRLDYEAEFGASAVIYKFVGFPKEKVGVIAIRGTVNGWDALADIQLWSSAALAQWIRAILPLGNFFTPVFEYLVEAVSWIESSHLEQVAFYKQTTAFVKHVTAEEFYPNFVVTGHCKCVQSIEYLFVLHMHMPHFNYRYKSSWRRPCND